VIVKKSELTMGTTHPATIPQTPMPLRIARLRRDARGYPIPWNVLLAEDGTPFFTVNDDRKHWAAIRGGLCPLCGEMLGRWKWFVGGPRSAFDENGWYMDLPGHHDCIEYALQVCPYLAAPKYAGRIDVTRPDLLPDEAKLVVDFTQIPERPEVFIAVAGTRVEMNVRENDFVLPYVRTERPVLAVEYWRHGKRVGAADGERIVRAVMGAGWTPPAFEVRP
jgi:hypothetical protein